MRKLSTATVNYILTLFDRGTSYTEITAATGASRGIISKIINEHRPRAEKPSGGRPRKLTDSDGWFIQRLITSGKCDTAVDVVKVLRDTTNITVSDMTVRRKLREEGLRARVVQDVPLLNKKQIGDRYDWAKAHQDYTMEDWRHVVWSDETKINCFGSDGRMWCWKRAGEGLTSRTTWKTVKHGGGRIMTWGCMQYGSGVGTLVRIDGNMDADLYCQILEDDMLGSLEEWGVTRDKIIFQQDNDPKHTSKKAKQWFQDNKIRVMQWPAQSPDLNPIEHLWCHLKKKLGAYETQPKGIEDLWDRVQEVWAAITPDVVDNLIDSMPQRVAAVIEAKGGSIDY